MSEVESKCVNTGNWLNMCNSLKDVTHNEYGNIQARIMTNRKSGSTRLQTIAGKFKNNRVELNYCPFCGVNIETFHKEDQND